MLLWPESIKTSRWDSILRQNRLHHDNCLAGPSLEKGKTWYALGISYSNSAGRVSKIRPLDPIIDHQQSWWFNTRQLSAQEREKSMLVGGERRSRYRKV